jgi:hypothetical protein
MLPHLETARKIVELHEQERRRDVAQQRRAFSSKARARSRPTKPGSAGLTGHAWLTGRSTPTDLPECRLAVERDRSPTMGTSAVARTALPPVIRRSPGAIRHHVSRSLLCWLHKGRQPKLPPAPEGRR